MHHGTLKHQAKHFFYAAGWKKFEPLWDAVIRARQLARMTPLLEGVLSRITRKAERTRIEDTREILPILQPDRVKPRVSIGKSMFLSDGVLVTPSKPEKRNI